MVRLIEKYEGEIPRKQYAIINKNSIKYSILLGEPEVKYIRDKFYNYFMRHRNWYSDKTTMMLNAENIKFIFNRDYFKTSTHINRNKIYQNNIIKDDLFIIEHIYDELKRNKIKYIGFIDWIHDKSINDFYLYEII